ncbi:Os02g0698200 [Oryza sativa Japonica Group]|uniref:Os02g0698200 protein n=1 Tax=Oryza sativa subsp. japonica TaxID=39947 RepID=A0A0P0VNI2_ORYSJ|nr:Os02g0698200 [Oryza sativa Japonica Group]
MCLQTANDTTAPAKPAGAGPQLKLLVDKHSRRRARTRWTSSSASSAFVSFVEADADVSLEEFGDSLCPPIPCTGELLTLPDSNFAVVTDRPLLYVQVTRLRCGGFVFSTQICHNLVDAAGITQFLQAVGELAEGAERPAGVSEGAPRRAPPAASGVRPPRVRAGVRRGQRQAPSRRRARAPQVPLRP